MISPRSSHVKISMKPAELFGGGGGAIVYETDLVKALAFRQIAFLLAHMFVPYLSKRPLRFQKLSAKRKPPFLVSLSPKQTLRFKKLSVKRKSPFLILTSPQRRAASYKKSASHDFHVLHKYTTSYRTVRPIPTG